MVNALLVLALLAIVAATVFVILFWNKRDQVARASKKLEQLRGALKRYESISDLEAEAQRLRAQIQEAQTSAQVQHGRLNQEIQQLQGASAQHAAQVQHEVGQLDQELQRRRYEIALLDDEAMFQAHGLYTPKYDFESSDHYKQRLDLIRNQQKRMVKERTAAVCTTAWVVGGSEAKGRKMSNDNLKLMLRAFNGECDTAVLKVRYNNVESLKNRILKSYKTINKLNQVDSCHITDPYLQLKLSELYLAHEYRDKKESEKEEQRRIKEQMREEQRANAELVKAQQDVEKEERRYRVAFEKAQAEVAQATGKKHARLVAKLEDLERRLKEAEERKARAVSQAQLTKAGHVYVISNIGSFGPNVFKIGMTRRLTPNDRVRELGDASVPFPFDVHAMIYTQDAPSLENALHKEFDARRVNKVNRRKEFFNISLREVADAVTRLRGQIEFTQLAEAEEFRRTQGIDKARAIQAA